MTHPLGVPLGIRSGAPAYPGRVVERGDPDPGTVRLIQHRLNQVGCGPLVEDGDFGLKTWRAVKLFQARFTDLAGQPLVVDGKIGPATWGTLFGAPAVAVESPEPGPLLSEVLAVAASQVGVMEEPPGSNRGSQVDAYLRAAGLDPGGGSYAWCCAFVYWCFGEACRRLGRPNPAVRTAGVLNHWRGAGERGIPRLPKAEALADPSRIRPGSLFVYSTGGGYGHIGIVEAVQGARLVTVEGNTNDGGSREGIGVFRRDSRKISAINLGYIDYSGA